jgi:hypothetical protein
MKLGMMFASSVAVAVVALASVGCSSESESEAKTGPVAASPLKGSIPEGQHRG